MTLPLPPGNPVLEGALELNARFSVATHHVHNMPLGDLLTACEPLVHDPKTHADIVERLKDFAGLDIPLEIAVDMHSMQTRPDRIHGIQILVRKANKEFMASESPGEFEAITLASRVMADVFTGKHETKPGLGDRKCIDGISSESRIFIKPSEMPFDVTDRQFKQAFKFTDFEQREAKSGIAELTGAGAPGFPN